MCKSCSFSPRTSSEHKTAPFCCIAHTRRHLCQAPTLAKENIAHGGKCFEFIFVYVSAIFVFIFLWNLQFVHYWQQSSETHLFTQRWSAVETLLKQCSVQIWVLWAHKFLATKQITHAKLTTEIQFHFATTVPSCLHSPMELQAENWFPLCTKLFANRDELFTKFSQKSNWVFELDEFCRNSNKTLEYHPLNKYWLKCY